MLAVDFTHIGSEVLTRSSNMSIILGQNIVLGVNIILQVNKKFRKFERKYRDCIKRNGDKIGTQTCYDIST